jgi:hypothetical protein
MFSPLPVDTFAKLYIFAGDDTLSMSLRVRSSQRGAGMGVAFTGMSPEDFEKLQNIAPSQKKSEPASQPAKPAAAQPAAQSARPADSRPYTAPQFDSLELPATPELFAAVIRVLLRRGLLTRTELLEELEKLKVPDAP